MPPVLAGFSALFLLVASACGFRAGGGDRGWIPIDMSPGALAKDAHQKRVERATQERIDGLVDRGGEEASKELFRYIHDAEPRTSAYAVRGVGRMGRIEDVPKLLEFARWNEWPVPKSIDTVAEALSDIGGAEACAALLDLYVNRVAAQNYRPGPVPNQRTVAILAQSIQRAECLSPEAQVGILRGYSEDTWARREVQEGATWVLAEEFKDARAAELLDFFVTFKDELATARNDEERVLLYSDARLPLWAKVWYFDCDGWESKEAALDFLFALLEKQSDERPDLSDFFCYQKVLAMGSCVVRSETSLWIDHPSKYFAGKRGIISSDLHAGDTEKAMNLLDSLERVARNRT